MRCVRRGARGTLAGHQARRPTSSSASRWLPAPPRGASSPSRTPPSPGCPCPATIRSPPAPAAAWVSGGARGARVQGARRQSHQHKLELLDKLAEPARLVRHATHVLCQHLLLFPHVGLIAVVGRLVVLYALLLRNNLFLRHAQILDHPARASGRDELAISRQACCRVCAGSASPVDGAGLDFEAPQVGHGASCDGSALEASAMGGGHRGGRQAGSTHPESSGRVRLGVGASFRDKTAWLAGARVRDYLSLEPVLCCNCARRRAAAASLAHSSLLVYRSARAQPPCHPFTTHMCARTRTSQNVAGAPLPSACGRARSNERQGPRRAPRSRATPCQRQPPPIAAHARPPARRHPLVRSSPLSQGARRGRDGGARGRRAIRRPSPNTPVAKPSGAKPLRRRVDGSSWRRRRWSAAGPGACGSASWASSRPPPRPCRRPRTSQTG